MHCKENMVVKAAKQQEHLNSSLAKNMLEYIETEKLTLFCLRCSILPIDTSIVCSHWKVLFWFNVLILKYYFLAQ